MAFENLLFNPLYGVHSPLVLGWSDDQLTPLVSRLSTFLADSLTEQMVLAIAAVARSIVTEEAVTGLGVHYARAKDPYRLPRRYKGEDPRFTWHYVTRAMDYLSGAGLIEHAVGEWYPHHKGLGLESVARATGDLVALVRPLIDLSDRRGLADQTFETIVLRDRNDRRAIDYIESATTTEMRDQVQMLNKAVAQLDLRRGGERIGIPAGRRIFNGSFERGGRFYFRGESIQNMPAEQRVELVMFIADQMQPVVEIDYAHMHIAMAYAEAEQTMPDGDLYAIEGHERAQVKLAVNIMFNARHRPVQAVANALREQGGLNEARGEEEAGLEVWRSLAMRLMSAIEMRHSSIKSYFGSDCGARFQRKDSDMAIEVMVAMIEKTGRCPLPVHDSFVVADVDAAHLGRTMREVAQRHGLRLNLKESRPLADCLDGGQGHEQIRDC